MSKTLTAKLQAVPSHTRSTKSAPVQCEFHRDRQPYIDCRNGGCTVVHRAKNLRDALIAIEELARDLNDGLLAGETRGFILGSATASALAIRALAEKVVRDDLVDDAAAEIAARLA